jgi:mRNA interferase HigB
MRIVAKKNLLAFSETHATARQSLLAWHEEAAKAVWASPQDIKDRYASASFVGHNRVVFNIQGNAYRLIVAVAYRIGVVYIKFIGTHAEYDAIDAETIELES